MNLVWKEVYLSTTQIIEYTILVVIFSSRYVLSLQPNLVDSGSAISTNSGWKIAIAKFGWFLYTGFNKIWVIFVQISY